MAGFILGIKGEQKRIFTETGEQIPVTYIYTPNIYFVGVRTVEKDGYLAIKLGIKTSKHAKKPVLGEVKKAGVSEDLNLLREFRLDRYLNLGLGFKINFGKEVSIEYKDKKIKLGEKLVPNLFFEPGEKVDVSGKSKGKGFQGVVKRHGFGGGPRTHGQSDRERAPGSIGQTTTPGRVYKGKRMAGRMGGERVTVQNLSVIEVGEDYLLVKGLVPGYKGSLLEVKPAIKNLIRNR